MKVSNIYREKEYNSFYTKNSLPLIYTKLALKDIVNINDTVTLSTDLLKSLIYDAFSEGLNAGKYNIPWKEVDKHLLNSCMDNIECFKKLIETDYYSKDFLINHYRVTSDDYGEMPEDIKTLLSK